MWQYMHIFKLRSDEKKINKNFGNFNIDFISFTVSLLYSVKAEEFSKSDKLFK